MRPLKLGGLSRDEVAQMLQALDPRAPAGPSGEPPLRRDRGNPFFVEEVYRHLVEDGRVFDAAGELCADITIGETDVPENVRLVIGRRLDRLEERERKVLAAAAVIGRSFSFELVQSLLDRVDVDELCDVIEKAQRMGLIVSSAEGPETPLSPSRTSSCVRRLLPQDGGTASPAAPRARRTCDRAAPSPRRRRTCGRDRRPPAQGRRLRRPARAGNGARCAPGRRQLEARSAFEEAHRAFESALARHED